MSPSLPAFAISHGGGPWPWLDADVEMSGFSLGGMWAPLKSALEDIPAQIGTVPKAVLIVTAHWEADVFAVQHNARPGMIYDFGGFPEHTYTIDYPAPGSEAVAARASQLLEDAGVPSRRDHDRGLDHGTYVPMHVMYPGADVPVVQLSIHKSFDAGLHIAAGRALSPLRGEGVAIVASGLPSYHNTVDRTLDPKEPSRQFDHWLTETMVGHVGRERSARLLHWEDAPAAHLAHPRPDHFLPLLVAAGAAEDEAGVRNYHEVGMWGETSSSGYRLGGHSTS